MGHPNEDLLRRGYDAFGKGDIDTLREIFSPDIKWHVPGRNAISGDYSGIDEVLGFFGKVAEVSGGTFRLEMHDILANDTHAVVLTGATGERNGKTLNDNVVHVWHIENGKATEYWGHAGDQYAVDEFWS